MLDKEGKLVAETTSSDMKGYVEIEDVKPWWPYLMNPEPGYLYTMEVFLNGANSEPIDIYRLKIGVRTLHWNSREFLINGKPIYFRGFGRHEDSDVNQGWEMTNAGA